MKAQLNRDLRPGRYALAGSTRYAAVPVAAQALTGRVDIVPVPVVSGRDRRDPRGLRVLKDRLGHRLEEAIVLYTGEYAYRHDGWTWILPLSRLWG